MNRSPHPLLRDLWRRGGAVVRWSREMGRGAEVLLDLAMDLPSVVIEPAEAALEPLLRDVELGGLVALTGVVEERRAAAGASEDDGARPGRRRPHADAPPRRRPAPSRRSPIGPVGREPHAAARDSRPPGGARPTPGGETAPHAWAGTTPGEAEPATRDPIPGVPGIPGISAEDARRTLRERASEPRAWDQLVRVGGDLAGIGIGARQAEGRTAGAGPPERQDEPTLGSERREGGDSGSGIVPRGAVGEPPRSHFTGPAGGGPEPPPPALPGGAPAGAAHSRLRALVARLEQQSAATGARFEGGDPERSADIPLPRRRGVPPRAVSNRKPGRGGVAASGRSPSSDGLSGLRGLAARVAGTGSGEPEETRAPSPAARPWDEEAELEARIAEILRREARRQGVDLEGVGP